MLGTRERSLLLESLRPPAGYTLGRAVGTTYTLDLPALLSVPLAFTFYNYQDESGEPTRDPVALFEALRRHAESVTLFCQAGAIAVPRPQLKLLSYLEGSIVQVRAPREEGVFHPKVWVLRFVAEGEPARYRVLCLSRNLTFDRAWDTCLVLEGEGAVEGAGSGDGRPTVEESRPLGRFLRALPDLATGPVPEEVRTSVERLADEVERVRFEPPEPFERVAFHPLGLDGALDRAAWPFPREATRSLVVSPFLAEKAVRRLARDHALEVLVSRPESLEPLPDELLPEDGTFVLSSGAELDAQEGDAAVEPAGGTHAGDGDGETEALTGLHAKLFLVQRGHRAHLFVGSANATSAAFGANVELLVELEGDRRPCGVDAFLGGEDDKLQDSFRSLLAAYRRPEAPEGVDPVEEALDRAAADLARAVGSSELTAHVGKPAPREEKGEAAEKDEEEKEDTYHLELRGELPPLPGPPVEARLAVWPATLSGEHRRGVERPGGRLLARFEAVTFEALTAFWAFDVELRQEGREAGRRFVVALPLVDAPKDRRARLLRSFLKDRRQVLRLLLLLLAEEGLDAAELVDDGASGEGAGWRRLAGWAEPTLLESLLQALVRDPKRLEEAARLIQDLRKTEEGRELLPPELDEVWGPIWAVHDGDGGAAGGRS